MYSVVGQRHFEELTLEFTSLPAVLAVATVRAAIDRGYRQNGWRKWRCPSSYIATIPLTDLGGAGHKAISGGVMFGMHSFWVYVVTTTAAICCGWIMAGQSAAQTQVILDEQFDGNAVDTSVFTFSGPGDESFFGRPQLNSPGLPGPFDAPTVAGGVLQLELNTFNQFSPGSFFLADEVRTIQQFAPTSTNGFSFETRARFVDDATNPLSPGLIGGAFLFGVEQGSIPLQRDEVDFELLSNFTQDTVLTNIFNDQGFTSAGNGQFVNVPGLDLTEFNDFRIETTLNSTQFFVNDTLVRNETVDLAVEPQDFRLNINAQGPEFAAAFSSVLQPTSDPTQNQTFIFEVDSLVIAEIAPSLSSPLFDTVINVPGDTNIGDSVTIGDVFGLSSTQLNVSDGGSVGVGAVVFGGSEVNISGGNVGIAFAALDDSVVNISGGTIDDFLLALDGSEFNISGGSIGDFFAGFADSAINLFGSDFSLNGVSLDETLSLGEAVTISDRGDDLILTGRFADGSTFSFDLNAASFFDDEFALIDDSGRDYFDSSATLTLTLVSAIPEPSSVVLGLSSLVLLGRRRK